MNIKDIIRMAREAGFDVYEALEEIDGGFDAAERFAALVQEPTKTVLSRGVNGVCSRSVCECEREGLGDQCIWLRPTDAELHRRKAALERTIK